MFAATDVRFFIKFQWNHFDNAGARTTNASEGWHRKLNARVKANPRLYSLIQELKEMQEELEADIRALDQGITVRPANAKYRRLHESINREKAAYAAVVHHTPVSRARYLDEQSQRLKGYLA